MQIKMLINGSAYVYAFQEPYLLIYKALEHKKVFGSKMWWGQNVIGLKCVWDQNVSGDKMWRGQNVLGDKLFGPKGVWPKLAGPNCEAAVLEIHFSHFLLKSLQPLPSSPTFGRFHHSLHCLNPSPSSCQSSWSSELLLSTKIRFMPTYRVVFSQRI